MQVSALRAASNNILVVDPSAELVAAAKIGASVPAIAGAPGGSAHGAVGGAGGAEGGGGGGTPSGAQEAVDCPHPVGTVCTGAHKGHSPGLEHKGIRGWHARSTHPPPPRIQPLSATGRSRKF